MVPWKKFHAMCSPIGTASLPGREMKNIPAVLAKPELGLVRWTASNNSAEEKRQRFARCDAQAPEAREAFDEIPKHQSAKYQLFADADNYNFHQRIEKPTERSLVARRRSARRYESGRQNTRLQK
jgi:hypothetical protein